MSAKRPPVLSWVAFAIVAGLFLTVAQSCSETACNLWPCSGGSFKRVA